MSLLSDIFNTQPSSEKQASDLSERDSLIAEIERTVPTEILKQADALALAEASNIYKQANLMAIVQPEQTNTEDAEKRASDYVSKLFYENKEASFRDMSNQWEQAMISILGQ